MKAIEFIADNDGGNIKIPQEYQSQLGGRFRVIILQEDADESKLKKRTFKSISITTSDIDFDRDEANER